MSTPVLHSRGGTACHTGAPFLQGESAANRRSKASLVRSTQAAAAMHNPFPRPSQPRHLFPSLHGPKHSAAAPARGSPTPGRELQCTWGLGCRRPASPRATRPLCISGAAGAQRRPAAHAPSTCRARSLARARATGQGPGPAPARAPRLGAKCSAAVDQTNVWATLWLNGSAGGLAEGGDRRGGSRRESRGVRRRETPVEAPARGGGRRRRELGARRGGRPKPHASVAARVEGERQRRAKVLQVWEGARARAKARRQAQAPWPAGASGSMTCTGSGSARRKIKKPGGRIDKSKRVKRTVARASGWRGGRERGGGARGSGREELLIAGGRGTTVTLFCAGRQPPGTGHGRLTDTCSSAGGARVDGSWVHGPSAARHSRTEARAPLWGGEDSYAYTTRDATTARGGGTAHTSRSHQRCTTHAATLRHTTTKCTRAHTRHAPSRSLDTALQASPVSKACCPFPTGGGSRPPRPSTAPSRHRAPSPHGTPRHTAYTHNNGRAELRDADRKTHSQGRKTRRQPRQALKWHASASTTRGFVRVPLDVSQHRPCSASSLACVWFSSFQQHWRRHVPAAHTAAPAATRTHTHMLVQTDKDPPKWAPKAGPRLKPPPAPHPKRGPPRRRRTRSAPGEHRGAGPFGQAPHPPKGCDAPPSCCSCFFTHAHGGQPATNTRNDRGGNAQHRATHTKTGPCRAARLSPGQDQTGSAAAGPGGASRRSS